MSDITIITIVACAGITATYMIAHRSVRNLQRIIDRQNDTIQRLINSEPVTYQETGQKPPKIIEEAYSAWGNVTVEREIRDD